MLQRLYPITPSQQATDGALSIFVEGCQKENIRQQLVGLSVLQSATEAQVHCAISSLAQLQLIPEAEIQSMLAR